MPDAISIGSAAIPSQALAGLIALAIAALVLRLTARTTPEIRPNLSAFTDRVFTALVVAFLAWKLTPLFYWWDAIRSDPVRLLRLPGGRPGLIAAVVLFLGFVVPRLWTDRKLLRPALTALFSAVVSYAVVLAALSTFAATTAEPAAQEIARLRAPALDRTRASLQSDDVPVVSESRPSIVTFWATWCGPCHAEIPVKQEAYRTHGDSVRVVAVNMTHTEAGPSAVIDYVTENELEYPIVFDQTGSISQLFGVRGTPTTVVLAADGTVVDRWMGPSDLGRINRAVAAAQGE